MTEYLPFAKLSEREIGQIRVIYEEAFPVHQRDNFADIEKRARDGDELIIAAVDKGVAVAFAAFSRLREPDWMFLEYFAVAAAHRKQGIGEALWHAAVHMLAENDETMQIVFEVEDPTEAPTASDERRQRERRVRFWERVGARLLPAPEYRVPNIDGSGVEPMLLLTVNAELQGKEDVNALVFSLLTQGYGLPAAHPLVTPWRRRKEEV